MTDNSCPPHPPRKNPIQELGDDIVAVRARSRCVCAPAAILADAHSSPAKVSGGAELKHEPRRLVSK